MIAALKQGAGQGLLQEPDEAQPGAMAAPSAALTRLLMTMLVHADGAPRTTRTYVYRDSNEQMFRILKVSASSPQGGVIGFVLATVLRQRHHSKCAQESHWSQCFPSGQRTGAFQF